MSEVPRSAHHAWLALKLRSRLPRCEPHAARHLARAVAGGAAAECAPLFENPFTVKDLLVFDDATLRLLLSTRAYGLTVGDLGSALHDAPEAVRCRIAGALPPDDRRCFAAHQRNPVDGDVAGVARQRLLDTLFWELTYWKTPELYEELTAGERLHPGIFQRLAPAIRGHTVLDAGAGSGRATRECLRLGAERVYAMEPSPGLSRILRRKLAASSPCQVTLLSGRFDANPLDDDTVDLALCCSAFTAGSDQGGEEGLAELRRVTRPGGKIVLIWPRPADYRWLAAHGFRYVALPVSPRMAVRYLSLAAALRVARRFYARKRAVLRHLLRTRRPVVPFSLLGDNPPHDYCWLTVEK